MANYNYNATIGQYLGQSAYDPSSLDRARQAGANVSRSVGEFLNARRADKEAEKKEAERMTGEQNKQKIVELVREYNDPRSQMFAGMDGKQRSLKMARLLYPLDAEMSKRYESDARNLEEKSAKFGQEKTLLETRESGLNERERIAAEAKKSAQGKARKASEIAEDGIGALSSGQYMDWFDTLGYAERMLVPSPETVSREKLQTIVSKDIAKGETLGNTIEKSLYDTTQAKAGASGAEIVLEQNKIIEGDFYQGIPKELEPRVNQIKNDFRDDTKDAKSVVAETMKLDSLLGDGTRNIYGSAAIAAVFVFMKSLDPRSTVRESEFDLVAGANGLHGNIVNKANMFASGTTIMAEQAMQMKNMIKQWRDYSLLKIQQEKGFAEKQLTRMKIDPSVVINDLSSPNVENSAPTESEQKVPYKKPETRKTSDNLEDF